ncbi:MAG TPA: antitoxin Xre-like helix-turn-helix domain-containing protein, partial [Chitinophagaceae bacterium]|nr:antitoxin Xre-like helix-turn-helix domain-containing protein [Chitinophagaceae bacterium]
AALYAPSVKIIPMVTDFSFKKFIKIADKVPFTQKEWANILHLSERTLQRYSKDNSSFEGIYIDRILQIEQLINLGLETFNNASALYAWLKKDKVVFNRVLNFESLYSYQGIQDTYNQIGRILHNVYT